MKTIIDKNGKEIQVPEASDLAVNQGEGEIDPGRILANSSSTTTPITNGSWQPSAPIASPAPPPPPAFIPTDAMNFAPTQTTAAQMAAPANIAAPVASGYNANQADLIKLLTNQANGTGGPSPAELLLKKAQDDNLNNQLALAASLSGRALPAAQRQVSQQQALGAQEAARQGAILRAQEQLQAQGLLSSSVNNAIGNDLKLSDQTVTADAINQTNTFKTNASNAGFTQDNNQFNSNLALNAAIANDNSKIAKDKMLNDQLLAALGFNAAKDLQDDAQQSGADAAYNKTKNNVLGGLASGVANAAVNYYTGGLIQADDDEDGKGDDLFDFLS